MATCPKCGTRYSSTVRICTHDGTVLNHDEAAPDPQIGKMLDGKYRLDAFLSHGGMGAVYKATHVMLDKTIAVKLIKPELVTSAEVVRRFQREARAASNLNHPNIIAVYDLGQTDDGTLYIAMEYIDGPSLKDVIRKTGPMPVARIVTILRQVGSALSLAHSHNIIHRDLKPHNVMLAKGPGGQEVPKLLDFGIAKTFEEGSTQLTQTGFALGTPQYMAPEQAAGKEVTAQSDLYSLGVMLYEMLTGEVPFDAPTTAAILIKQLTETPEPPSRRKPGVSPALEAVAMQCLDKEPQRRFADADAFIEALNRVGAGEAPKPDAPTRVFSAPTVVAPPGAAPTVLNAPTNVPTAAAHPPVADATRPSPPLVAAPPPPPMPAVAPPPVATPLPVMAAPPVIAAPPVAAAPPPPADTRPTVPTPAAVIASAGTTPSRTGLYITLGAIAVLLVAVVAGAAMQFGLFGSGGGSDSAKATQRVASAPQTSPAAADNPPAAAPVSASPAPAPASPAPAPAAAVEAPPPSASRAATPPQLPATVPAAAPRSGGTAPSPTAAAAATANALEATRQALATAAAAARTNAQVVPSAPPAGAAPAQAPAASRTPAPAAAPAPAPEPAPARAARPEHPPTFFRCTGFPAVCNALRASLLESMQKGDIPPARDPGRAAVILTANVEVVQDRVSRDFGTVMNTRTYTVDITGETKDGDPISMPPPRTFSFDAQYGRERLDENARLIAADTVEKIRAFWKK